MESNAVFIEDDSDIDTTNTSDSNKVAPESKNPWPNLEKLFSFHSKAEQNLRFECLLCRPKTVHLSTYATSHSNLRKHVKVKIYFF